jgi:hypothetical protein
LKSCFFGTWLRYFTIDSEMVPASSVTIGLTFIIIFYYY